MIHRTDYFPRRPPRSRRSSRHNPPPKAAAARLTLVAWVAASLCAVSRVTGASVVIVRASDAEPYVQADAAARERLVAAGNDVRSMLAKDVSDKGVGVTLGKADVVVAVGTASAKWLHQQPALPAKLALVYCMVNSASEAGLLQGRECWGITTEVAVSEQVKLIVEALPRARSLGMLYRSDAQRGGRLSPLFAPRSRPTGGSRRWR